MDAKLQSLDLNTLKTLYEMEQEELNAALLEGVSWDDLKDRRKMLFDLARVLQAKRSGELNESGNPAERSSRVF